MHLEPGRKLSHYRLVEKIGAGGMGEVWKAEDGKLDREVAIKVLPAAFAADPARLARFEREAKILASLNHPNIAAIYGLEESDGIRFLVLELVPGETLADMVSPGPLPVAEVLEIGRQIAEALEAAHESAVLHRDLKPANVKVTPGGKVKVLDFGLAKSLVPESPAGDLTQSPTITSGGTQDGVILGTAAYMSPEQARGKPLDRRTDIWSFGCVLYEALVGRRPFGGETLSDAIARILERDPDWGTLPKGTPSRLADLLRRCLRKDAQRRLRDIGDARIEIEEILEDPSSTLHAETAPTRQPSVWVFGALALVSALAGAAIAWMALPGAPSVTSGELEVAHVARLTHDPGLSEWPTWSPDGSLLAFASDRDGDFDIYVRRVDGGHEVNVTDDPGQDFQPAFSPDGNRIAFVSTRSSRTGMIKIGATWGVEFRTMGGDLWVAPALGGQARRLAPDANFPAWHPDGGRIAYASGPENHRSILTVAADGGSPEPVLDVGSSNWEIVRLQYAPGGEWISFETLEGIVWLLPASGGTPHELAEASSHVWDATGRRLYYLSRDLSGGTRLLFVEIDAAKGQVRGEPRAFSLMTGFLRDLAISQDGRQLATSELEGSLNLTLLPLTAEGDAPAGSEEVVNSGLVIDRYPAFSPDGRRIAFASDRLGGMKIWISNLDTGRLRQLQLPGEDRGANLVYWSPDGQQLAITRFAPDSTQSLWLAAADGSQAEELVPPTPGLTGSAFSPDGRSVLHSATVGGYRQLFAVDLATRESHQLTSSQWDTFSAEWSPDGRWLAVVSNQGGPVQVWRMPASGGPTEPLTTGDERVRHAFYSPDGRWVYYQPSHRNIYRVPAAGGTAQAVTTFPESRLFIEEPAISPDGRSLAYCRSNGGSSLWLLTLDGGPESP